MPTVPTPQPNGLRTDPRERVTVLVGNPKPSSRTAHAAVTLARHLAGSLGTENPAEVSLVDLATLGAAVLDPRSEAFLAAHRQVSQAAVVIVASPVYKASYTGLLKVFLDGLPGGALHRTVAVPVTLAASSPHRDLADIALRPVLAALGASVPAPGLTLEEPDLARGSELAQAWVDRHAAVVAAASEALLPEGVVVDDVPSSRSRELVRS